MNKLFKKKTEAKPKVEMATAPEEPETVGETKHIGELDEQGISAQAPAYHEQPSQIPVILSPTQVANLTLENNIMLKELMAIATE